MTNWNDEDGIVTRVSVRNNPFGRGLICQALVEQRSVIAGDSAFRGYAVNVLW